MLYMKTKWVSGGAQTGSGLAGSAVYQTKLCCFLFQVGTSWTLWNLYLSSPHLLDLPDYKFLLGAPSLLFMLSCAEKARISRGICSSMIWKRIHTFLVIPGSRLPIVSTPGLQIPLSGILTSQA